jgi:hypothetical protein
MAIQNRKRWLIRKSWVSRRARYKGPTLHRAGAP